MADARGTTMSVRITGTASSGEECTFSSSGRTITFAGFLKAYVESVDSEAGGEADNAERRLPQPGPRPGDHRDRADPGRPLAPARRRATPSRA